MIKFVPRRRISNNSPEGRGRGRSLEGFTRAEIPITDRHETGASSRRRLSQGSPRLLSIFSCLLLYKLWFFRPFFLPFSFFFPLTSPNSPLVRYNSHSCFVSFRLSTFKRYQTYRFEGLRKLKYEIPKKRWSFILNFLNFYVKNICVFIFHIFLFETKLFFARERKIGKKHVFFTN